MASNLLAMAATASTYSSGVLVASVPLSSTACTVNQARRSCTRRTRRSCVKYIILCWQVALVFRLSISSVSNLCPRCYIHLMKLGNRFADILLLNSLHAKARLSRLSHILCSLQVLSLLTPVLIGKS